MRSSMTWICLAAADGRYSWTADFEIDGGIWGI